MFLLQVEIACVVEEKLIQTIMNSSSSRDLNDARITVKELLHIVHSDKHHQVNSFFILCYLNQYN